MITKKLTLTNELGLHARAASRFVLVSNGFVSKVRITHNKKTVDGKSIISLMMLSLAKGDSIKITCDGEDEKEALNSLCNLVENRFGEAE